MQNEALNMLWSASEINQYSKYNIYKYSENYYKLIIYKYINNYDRHIQDDDEIEQISEDDIKDDLKLSNNIYRAKSKIFEYAMCNEWDYFVTLTIDGSKYNRENIKEFMKVFSKWLQDFQRYHGKIKYVLIPELHKDEQNWHLHGLMKFENYIEVKTKKDTKDLEQILSESAAVTITYFKPSRYKNNGRKLWAKQNNEKFYLNWEDYEDKFGINVFAKIKNKEAVSSYITKYITKSLFQFNSEGKRILNRIALGQNLYYCSQGLEKREVVESGQAIEDSIIRFAKPKDEKDFSYFENDFMIIKTLSVEEYENAKHHLIKQNTLRVQEQKQYEKQLIERQIKRANKQSQQKII